MHVHLNVNTDVHEQAQRSGSRHIHVVPRLYMYSVMTNNTHIFTCQHGHTVDELVETLSPRASVYGAERLSCWTQLAARPDAQVMVCVSFRSVV